MPGLVGFTGDGPDSQFNILLSQMIRAAQFESWYTVDQYHTEGIHLARVSLGLANPEPQPVWNEDRSLCLFLEGEIYGYEDLKQNLIERQHQFIVQNDAEFILHLYEEFGEEFAKHLNGAYVVALWDSRAKKLLVVNDRLGSRPLYYALHGRRLFFAPNVGPLLAVPGLSKTLDAQSVSQFLTFNYILGNRTLLEAVTVLPPASILTFEQGRLTIYPYWRLQFQERCHPRKEDEILEGYVHYLRQAIARQMGHDGLSAGVLLSGGLDSRAILSYIQDSDHLPPVYTFTFGIPDCDDARFAAEVARARRTKHVFHELRPDYLISLGDEAIRRTDGAMNCINVHSFANLREQTRKVSVLYKGYLGDALLGGHLERRFWSDYEKDVLDRMLFNAVAVSFKPEEQQELFTVDFQNQIQENSFYSFQSALAESNAEIVANRQNEYDILQRQRRFILLGVELVRTHAVARTPFCDKDLVDFMLTIPPGFRYERFLMVEAFIRFHPDLAKIPYTQTGRPMMDCVRDLLIRLEDQFRWHLRQAGLAQTPFRQRRPYADYNGWMRSALRSWVEETLLSKQCHERGVFNPGAVRRLVKEHMEGANHAHKLGGLIALERWQRQYLD